MDWKPIESAPKDGTAIIVLAGADSFRAQWSEGFVSAENDNVGAWTAVSDLHPDDWTDGVCWDVNDAGLASTRPTHWQPLPEPPHDQRPSDG